jgi:hypothetical protein
MADKSLFSLDLLYYRQSVLKIAVFIACMLIVEWIGRENQFALEKLGLKWKKPLRWGFYLLIAYVIVICFSTGKPAEFIYFQF